MCLCNADSGEAVGENVISIMESSNNNNKGRAAIIGALIGVVAFWSFQWGMLGNLLQEDVIWVAIIPGALIGGGIGWAVGAKKNNGTHNNTSDDSNTDNITQELINYKKLLDAGIITEEEFAKKKDEILKNI